MSKKKTSKKRTRPASKKKSQGFLGFLFKWSLVIGLWAGIFLTLLFAWYATELPDITKDSSFERKTAITIKAYDGSVITRYGEIQGETMGITDLPPHLIDAVLAIEDRRFYSHFGIDLLGLARAMFVNVSKGRLVQGGSTITQQLAKNLFLSQERTLKRKIQEAMLAVWLEYELTKDEILSAYLNRVYLGSGTYGVDAASRLYFNKEVKALNLREAATIAGLLKAPSRYSPLQNPGLSKERADVVLGAMVDAGYITEDQAKSLTSLPPRPSSKPTGGSVRYFTDWVVDGVDDLIGTPQEDIIVETTLNPRIQDAAYEALARVIREQGEERRISQGAVVIMRPDGTVVAMVGGADYAVSQFNRAVQAKRQPGSSFKPFTYLTALENGWDPYSRIIDEPFKTGRYRPENFGGKYYGEVTLTEALTLSLNTVSVQLMKELGPAAVAETARRFGIFSPLELDLSLALGSSSVSMLEMATAYSVMANGGYRVFPYAITKIISADGELYYQRPRTKLTQRMSAPGPLNDLRRMMQSVVENGTGQRARLPFYPAAGKTGTSQDSRDAWFIGYTDELVGAVWLGNDDNSSTKAVTGGSFPAGIWQEVMIKSRGAYRPVEADNFITSTFESLIGRWTGGAQNDNFIDWNSRRETSSPARNAHEKPRYNQ